MLRARYTCATEVRGGAMLKWTALLLAVLAPIVPAQEPVSVGQLEQLLISLRRQSDRKAARRLSDLELTERAGSARLAKWEAALPGRRCRDALTALADSSAFLDLPADDLDAKPAPSIAEQRAMLNKVVETTMGTIHRLPNFYATRLTLHFDDAQTKGPFFAGSNKPPRPGAMPENIAISTRLHATGTSKETVSYRNGQETRNARILDFVNTMPERDLTTSGEFGPVLIELFQDAVGSPMIWTHWVRTAHGDDAVFRYAVPAAKSHFLVVLPLVQTMERVVPAYHGEVEINPETGTILRITMVAAMAPPDQMVVSSMAVEYGPVNIGGQNYVCPLKGLALSKMPLGGSRDPAAPMLTEVNDVKFVDYHLFRSESRIVTDVPPESGQGRSR